MTQKQTVVIIGGGPAGLTAAWELMKGGGADAYDVTVLEATREFGGISRTVKHNGNRMDIGGHRFFSKDDRIMPWWRDTLPLQGAPSYDDRKLGRHHDLEPGGPDPETCDEVVLKRHRVSRIYWNRHFFDYPISLSPNTLKAMGPKLTLEAGFSYLKSMVHKLPEDNLENFYINRFGRKLYSMFFEGYTEKLWGRHPSQISADWGAQRVKGLSIRAINPDVGDAPTAWFMGQLPLVLLALFAALIFATMMSTASSGIQTAVMNITRDILPIVAPGMDDKKTLKISRGLSLALMILAILMCLVFTDTLTWLTATYAYSAATLACPIFVSYAFRKKKFITTPGVIAGMVAGLVGCLVGTILETPISYAAVGIGFSLVAMLVVCAFTKGKGAVQLDN